jgi:hypothetical protein
MAGRGSRRHSGLAGCRALRRYLGASHQVDWTVGGGAISDVTATVNPCLVDEAFAETLRRPVVAGCS